MQIVKQPWYQITAAVEIVVAGVAITGAGSVQCAVRRKSDGFFLAAGGGSWAVGYAQNLMPEVDAATIPGLYSFTVAPADLDFKAREYLIEIKSPIFGAMPSPLLEFALVQVDHLDAENIHRSLLATDDLGEVIKLTETAGDATGVRFTDSALLLVKDEASFYHYEALVSQAGGATITFSRKVSKINVAGGYFEVEEPIDPTGGGIVIGDTAILVRTPVVTTTEINRDSLATRHGIVNSEITDSSPGLLCTTADASGLKFYDNVSTPSTTRSADYLGRLGVYSSPAAWQSGGVTPSITMIRIGGIANDVDGDHMLITKLDGKALDAPGVVVGDGLIILNANDHMPEEHFDSTMSGHNTVNTFGDYFRRMLGLRQKHTRSIYLTFNGAGQPLTGKVLIYATGVDLTNDTSPWALATGEYDFSMTYDGSGRLTEYISKETA